ncbi:MAG: putative efflux pump protein [Rhizorhabdus sp.]|nr:putative efflux pump protein [Rhizorhabdus sp.]
MTRAHLHDGGRAVFGAAMLATYMQAVAISIPNAAVFHIGGSLSMADDEIGWLFTSYIVASAVVAPLARWLAGAFGRKTVFQLSIAMFALGLLLCTFATTPLQLVAARIVQGAASGTIGPLSLAILLDGRPSERHGRITLAWTVTLLFGMFSGPALGGWLGEYHGWRSIFYLGLPASGLILLIMGLSLSEKKADPNPPLDMFGLATFSLGLVGLQMLLDRGERLEWFASTEIWIEALASALGFYLYIVHALTAKAHFLDKALFRDRNFVLSTLMFFAFGFVLLPTLALTSPMQEELLGYPADTTGYLTIPRGLALLGALILGWRAPTRIDNRLLVIGATGLVVYANWRMLGYSPLMDWRPVVAAGILQGAGLGMLMPALTRAAFSTLDPKLRPEGNALFNLARLYGSTLGIGVVQIFFHNNLQAMHLALAQNITPQHVAAHAPGLLSGPARAVLNEIVTGQAAMIAMIGQFKILMIVMLVAGPLALFLRKARPTH